VRRLALLAALAVVAAGCSDSKPGENVVSPVPGNTLVTQTVPAVPAEYAHGDPTAGKQVFESAGCKACHTLAAAGATGTVGPNLDQLKPPLGAVVTQVLNGGGVMPAFKNQLTAKQIADVSAFVVQSTSG
jgi:mono/diheme cytochrome c family protein